MINVEPLLSNTCIVIITFNPQPNIKNKIDELVEQYQCVVVDNNSDKDELELLANEKLIIIRNNSNMGIAYALNQGLEKAEQLGWKWAITMDQDSYLHQNAMDVFNRIYNSYPNPNQIAMIAGNYVGDIKENILRYACSPEADYSEVDTIITSGCLTNIAIWREIGKFNNGYFIDNVDDEFCLRASLHNYKTLATNEVVLEHQIGEISPAVIKPFKLFYPKKLNPGVVLNRKQKIFRMLNIFNYRVRTYGPYNINYGVHSPSRWYYQGRNITATVLKYRKTHKHWCKQNIRSHTIKFAAMLLVDKHRYKKAFMYLKGVLHGLLRRRGPL